MVHVFQEQLCKHVEVYVDNHLVKSNSVELYPQHLANVFNMLCRVGIKLNPTKYTFGVTRKKFLGHFITKRGIEANPNQIRAIWNMKALTTQNKVQELVGRLAALSHFISHSIDRCKPIFILLRKTKNAR